MALHSLLNKAKHKSSRATEYYELVLSQALSASALAIVAIFLPIYLYELGKSLTFIALYFMVYFAVKYFHHQFTIRYIVKKFGLKHSILLALILYAISYGIVAEFSQNNLILMLPIFLLSLAEGLKVDAQHVDMLLFSEEKTEGTQVGVISVVENMGRVFGPFVAGVVSETYGVQYALLLGSLMLVASSVPLFFTSEIKQQTFSKPQSQKPPLRYRIANFANNFEGGASFMIWPIFIFFLLEGDFTSTGAFFSLGFFISVVAVTFFSRLVDRRPGLRDQLFASMTTTRISAHVLRLFSATSPGLAVVANSVGELGSSQKSATFSVRYYTHGKHADGKLEYIQDMEQFGDLANLVLWSTLLGLLFVFSDKLALLILFGAAAIVATQLIRMKERG